MSALCGANQRLSGSFRHTGIGDICRGGAANGRCFGWGVIYQGLCTLRLGAGESLTPFKHHQCEGRLPRPKRQVQCWPVIPSKGALSNRMGRQGWFKQESALAPCSHRITHNSRSQPIKAASAQPGIQCHVDGRVVRRSV